MGAIRLILALSVLIHHGGRFGAGTDTLRLLAADMAVYLFFIISGLYIASALERSYLNQLNGIWRFYANRCVRLYPAYWFVVLLAVLSAVFLFKGHHAYFQGFSDLSFNLANVFIIGQDALGPLFAFQYTINAPAWSLSVELMFYALAPFLVMLLRSTWSAAAATLIVIWLMSPSQA